MTKCELNQIFLGEIASIQNYGAFIKIPGTAQQGLIHRSQVSSAHVDNVADILQKGERVWCKVISMAEDGKIGLSMKYVNQGNGTDLDPNGVELQKDIQRRKDPGTVEHKVIQLEAVLNTTCAKCGTKGHLSKDCFMSPDGKTYELLPEIEEKPQSIPEPVSEDKDKDKVAAKKHKLKKKKKKSKKSKQSTNDGDVEDKERHKKKKKSSKERKKHRKKRSNNSDADNLSPSHNVKSNKRKHSDDSETRTKKCKHSKTKHLD